MPRTDDDIVVSIDLTTDCVPFAPARIRELVRFVCRHFRIRRASVDLAITDNPGIRRVNRRFFASSAVTDCISFDLTDPSEPGRCFSIIVNAELAQRQALLRGHSSRAELALYIVHGMLHQFGFDDLTVAAAERMHRQEDHLLARAGYGVVYHNAASSGPRRSVLSSPRSKRRPAP
jgi:probable rRNA maturation factor